MNIETQGMKLYGVISPRGADRVSIKSGKSSVCQIPKIKGRIWVSPKSTRIKSKVSRPGRYDFLVLSIADGLRSGHLVITSDRELRDPRDVSIDCSIFEEGDLGDA